MLFSINRWKRLAVIWTAAFGISFLCTKAQAQYVLDSAFCLGIKNKECAEAIPDGATLNLSNMPTKSGEKRIYFWTVLRAASDAAISIGMIREGKCYRDELTLPREKFVRRPTTFQTVWSYLSSLRLGDILSVFDVQKGDVEVGVDKGVDAKINIAVVPQANRYRIYDYRFVQCAGTIRARVLDSAGEPIPGGNDVKVLLVSE